MPFPYPTPLWRVAEDAQRLETGEERSFSLQENASRNSLKNPTST